MENNSKSKVGKCTGKVSNLIHFIALKTFSLTTGGIGKLHSRASLCCRQVWTGRTGECRSPIIAKSKEIPTGEALCSSVLYWRLSQDCWGHPASCRNCPETAAGVHLHCSDELQLHCRWTPAEVSGCPSQRLRCSPQPSQSLSSVGQTCCQRQGTCKTDFVIHLSWWTEDSRIGIVEPYDKSTNIENVILFGFPAINYLAAKITLWQRNLVSPLLRTTSECFGSLSKGLESNSSISFTSSSAPPPTTQGDQLARDGDCDHQVQPASASSCEKPVGRVEIPLSMI